MGNPKLKSEIEMLRRDASKIVSDISSLSKTVGTVGKEKSQEVAEEVSKRAEMELNALRERMSVLEERSREYAKALDSSVKQNPYIYILGFLGLGLLLGKLGASGNR